MFCFGKCFHKYYCRFVFYFIYSSLHSRLFPEGAQLLHPSARPLYIPPVCNCPILTLIISESCSFKSVEKNMKALMKVKLPWNPDF